MQPKRHRAKVWTGGGVLVLIFMIVLAVIGRLSQPSAPCTQGCPTPPPPTSPSLAPTSTYHSSRFGFSLPFDPNYAGAPNVRTATTVGWQFNLRNGGYLDARIGGFPSRGAGSQEAVDSIHSGSAFSQFQPVYSLPDPEVGYLPATGEVYEGVWSPLSGQSVVERLVIVASTQKGIGIGLVCEAPKVQDEGGHPNPAELGIGADQFCDNLLNGLVWRGQKAH